MEKRISIFTFSHSLGVEKKILVIRVVIGLDELNEPFQFGGTIVDMCFYEAYTYRDYTQPCCILANTYTNSIHNNSAFSFLYCILGK